MIHFMHKYQKNFDLLGQISRAFPQKYTKQTREYQDLLTSSRKISSSAALKTAGRGYDDNEDALLLAMLIK